MTKWLKAYKFYLFGALAGAAGGYLYWKYIGCLSGTCAITSNPVNSTLYFAFMGAFYKDETILFSNNLVINR